MTNIIFIGYIIKAVGRTGSIIEIMSRCGECLADARKMLKERFGIEHTTLQVEGCDASCGAECRLEWDN
jgi:hypothetical protein